MNRRIFVLGCLLAVPNTFPQAADSSHTGSSLEVAVKYTGSGTVDASHKLYVVLWDNADFVKDDYKGPNPFAVKPMESTSGTVIFNDVPKNPVYVSLAYDPTGKWQGDTEPPVGTSLGLYSTEPRKPAAIQLQPGKTTKVSATLDDSYKNPGKKSQ